jgi:hypothetical protein
LCKKLKRDYLYGMHAKKLVILFLLPLFSLAQPAVQWRKAIKNGIQSINTAVAICAEKSGNVFIAGTTHEADSTTKILLVKLDSLGNEQWRRVYQNDDRRDAASVALVIDVFGNSIITGTVKNASGNTDIITQKYSPEGILLWQNIYAGKANLFDAPGAVAADKKGNVFVCGHETASEANPDLLLIRYNTSGEKSFVKNYSSPKMDVAVDVVVDDSCNAYVCGNIQVSTRTSDMIVMKFDSSGNPKWNYVYDGAQHAVDVATDMSFDDSTNIFITGSANFSNDRSDIPLIKLNRNGKLLCDQLISEGVTEGEGHRLVSAGKNLLVQATFTDYLQQTVTGSIFHADKNCRSKYKIKPASEDVSYLKAYSLPDNTTLLLGSMLSRPENTIAPYIGITDSLDHINYEFHDDVLISLLRIKDVLLAGRDIYFLGDDATENAGTLSVAKYSFPEELKKTQKIQTKKRSDVYKNQ